MVKSKTYYNILELINEVTNKSKVRPARLEHMDVNGFSQTEVGEEYFLPGEDFVVTTSTLFDGLSTLAVKLVMQAMAEIHQNNMLWWYDHQNKPRVKIAFAELRRRGILHKTENSSIHLVNPLYLRKGSIKKVLALTANELKDVRKVTRDNIRPLKPENITFRKIDQFTLPASVTKTAIHGITKKAENRGKL